MTQFKQLTADERRAIERMLNKQLSLRKIAEVLERHPQTIAREIRRNCTSIPVQGVGYNSRTPNDCANVKTCSKKLLCGQSCTLKGAYCKICPRCNDVCPDFVKAPCEYSRDRSPWVCNGCPLRYSCRLKRRYYRAEEAHKIALTRRMETREGITLTEDEIHELDDLFSPRIKKGQSIHSIYTEYKDLMPCSERMIYKIIAANLLQVRDFDLPLKVRRKPRVRKKTFKVDRTCFVGRTYNDFQLLKNSTPGLNEVQMDTVVGPLESKKVFLTLYWPKANFLMAYLLPRNRSYYVLQVFRRLRKKLKPDEFQRLFPVILTDRGSEFTNPTALEAGLTHVFYCDPQAPQQKGAIEQEHSMIRRVVPKGFSFDHFTAKETQLMVSHITSYRRPGLGDRTPQEAFEFFYEIDPRKLFHIQEIASEDVNLTNRLLPGMRGKTLGEITGLTNK